MSGEDWWLHTVSKAYLGVEQDEGQKRFFFWRSGISRSKTPSKGNPDLISLQEMSGCFNSKGESRPSSGQAFFLVVVVRAGTDSLPYG
jgi:hypothetical protein